VFGLREVGSPFGFCFLFGNDSLVNSENTLANNELLFDTNFEILGQLGWIDFTQVFAALFRPHSNGQFDVTRVVIQIGCNYRRIRFHTVFTFSLVRVRFFARIRYTFRVSSSRSVFSFSRRSSGGTRGKTTE